VISTLIVFIGPGPFPFPLPYTLKILLPHRRNATPESLESVIPPNVFLKGGWDYGVSTPFFL